MDSLYGDIFGPSNNDAASNPGSSTDVGISCSECQTLGRFCLKCRPNASGGNCTTEMANSTKSRLEIVLSSQRLINEPDTTPEHLQIPDSHSELPRIHNGAGLDCYNHCPCCDYQDDWVERYPAIQLCDTCELTRQMEAIAFPVFELVFPVSITRPEKRLRCVEVWSCLTGNGQLLCRSRTRRNCLYILRQDHMYGPQQVVLAIEDPGSRLWEFFSSLVLQGFQKGKSALKWVLFRRSQYVDNVDKKLDELD